jgi:hypothetical protein
MQTVKNESLGAELAATLTGVNESILRAPKSAKRLCRQRTQEATGSGVSKLFLIFGRKSVWKKSRERRARRSSRPFVVIVLWTVDDLI